MHQPARDGGPLGEPVGQRCHARSEGDPVDGRRPDEVDDRLPDRGVAHVARQHRVAAGQHAAFLEEREALRGRVSGVAFDGKIADKDARVAVGVNSAWKRRSPS